MLDMSQIEIAARTFPCRRPQQAGCQGLRAGARPAGSSAAQTRPQFRLPASIGIRLRPGLGMNRRLKGAPQPGMLDTPDVLFENGLTFRIIELRDRLANLIARSPKEARRRPPPLSTERIDCIRRHQHRQLVLRIPRDRETQQKEQPFTNLPGAMILRIGCASRCARSSRNGGRAPFCGIAGAVRRASCLPEHGNLRSRRARLWSRNTGPKLDQDTTARLRLRCRRPNDRTR
jgi:hypothetical protein